MWLEVKPKEGTLYLNLNSGVSCRWIESSGSRELLLETMNGGLLVFNEEDGSEILKRIMD